MKLLLTTEIEPLPIPIEPSSRLFFMGSCFAENISRQFERYLFTIKTNPFGILYNPVSIEKALERMAGDTSFGESDLFFHDGLWHSFSHHSSFSGITPEETVEAINGSMIEGRSFLKEAHIVLITLGSAHVYYHQSDPVANCHRVPGNSFTRERLSLEEGASSLCRSIEAIRSLNNKALIVFTVSPVRYWRDGLVESTRSKSVLHLAIEKCMSETKGTFYFPSYEIVLDELRDYRFFKEDRSHPNHEAILYLWEKICDTWLSSESLQYIKEIEPYILGREHIPRFPRSEENMLRLEKLEKRFQELTERYPHFKKKRGQ